MVRILYKVLATMILGANIAAAQEAAVPSHTTPPIIFVHGNGDDAAKWVGITWLFESNGYPSDHLFSIRFINPVGRSDDRKFEADRSSTLDEASELSALVTRVLLETHAPKVVLIGSSRGGITIRNYIENAGGAAAVSQAILCGTPNHGVWAADSNNGGEFNTRGEFLRQLNQHEQVDGVRFMTIRSDHLDKYAQPNGQATGQPQLIGAGYEGPALKGAENIVLPGADHRELAFTPQAFAEMYHFVTGMAPTTLRVLPEANTMISGVITGFSGPLPTNRPLAGVHLRVVALEPGSARETVDVAYETTTTTDGSWGPFHPSPGRFYEFDLERDGRHVRYFKSSLPRSTTLLNLRFVSAPNDKEASHAERILIARPQGYFSSGRDPVLIDGLPAKEEPAGMPVRDSFSVAIAAPDPKGVQVKLRDETIFIRPSADFATDLPIADFLW